MLMVLAPEEAVQFFKLHKALMYFANRRLRVVPGVDAPEKFAQLAPENCVAIRNALWEQKSLLDAFMAENPDHFSQEELGIVTSWRHGVAGKFFVFRHLQNYSVFLNESKPPTAYGVVALSQPLEFVVGPTVPVLVEGLLLPFRDKIVYDGLLSRFSISFGPGVRRGLNESYQTAKANFGIVTTLPRKEGAAVASQPRSKPKPTKPKSGDANDVATSILNLVENFCREHLNQEYADLCRKLTEKLARKRPSPLLSGKPHTWASAIVRTIGGVNFLHDPAQTPHLKSSHIDAAFGVSASAALGKAALIRQLFRISPLDPDWTLPSLMDDNPRAWLIQVNGLIVDARSCPLELQLAAYEKGLIPYVPGLPE